MPSPTKHLLAAATVLAAGFALAGCTGDGDAAPTTAPESTPAPVPTAETSAPNGTAESWAGYFDDVAAAADVVLSTDDLQALDEAAPVGAAAGDRYPDMSSVHV